MPTQVLQQSVSLGWSDSVEEGQSHDELTGHAFSSDTECWRYTQILCQLAQARCLQRLSTRQYHGQRMVLIQGGIQHKEQETLNNGLWFQRMNSRC